MPATHVAGIDLTVERSPSLPATMDLDPERMTQVLSNLLDNALRHAPRGERIEISAQPAAGDAEIRVRGRGPGIPQHELELVFERLYRSDKPSQRHAGGSGLGLAIAKSIVEAHSGTRPGRERGRRGDDDRRPPPRWVPIMMADYLWRYSR